VLAHPQARSGSAAGCNHEGVPRMNNRPLLLDCDTGIDDALALTYLLNCDTDLVGISTVSGNTSAQQASANTLALLALAGRPGIPVAVGEHDPRTGGVPRRSPPCPRRQRGG